MISDWRSLVAVARRIVGDRDSAQDCVQDALLAVLRRDERLKLDGDALRAYLYRTVRNTALSATRSVRKREWDELASLVDGTPSPDAQIHAGELRRAVHDAVTALPPALRRVFVFTWLRGMPRTAVAELLDVTPHTVSNYLNRALSSIRSTVSPYFDR